MNGKEVRIMLMRCDGCEATARYNIHSSVDFVDARRVLEAKCTCKEE